MNEPEKDVGRNMSAGDGEDSGFFQSYAEFSKSLRTWFVAYGIGAPILIVSNKDALAHIGMSLACLRFTIYLFLSGSAIQVFEALLYKSAMWKLYCGELEPRQKDHATYKVADALSNAAWLEFILDLASLALFSVATVWLVQSLK